MEQCSWDCTHLDGFCIWNPVVIQFWILKCFEQQFWHFETVNCIRYLRWIRFIMSTDVASNDLVITSSPTPIVGSNSDVILFLSSIKIIIGVVGILGNSVVLVVLIKIPTQKVKFLIASQATIDLVTSAVLIADTITQLYRHNFKEYVESGHFAYLYCLFLARFFRLILPICDIYF